MAATFFITHGPPPLSTHDDDSLLPVRPFLKSFSHNHLPDNPTAILIISAHWDTTDPTVTAVSGPNNTIYDFPEIIYKPKYPAPGSPGLAARVKHLLQSAGLGPVRVDAQRGLDSGAWVPLMLMYPNADIPVCQLSIQSHKDAEHHYRLGEALRPVKDEGVLVLGSGAATHNLGMMNLEAGESVEAWAYEFDSWMTEAVTEGRYGDVKCWMEKAPHATTAHPRPDHLYPLHVAMGAAGDNTRGEVIHRSWIFGTLSYTSYKFVEIVRY